MPDLLHGRVLGLPTPLVGGAVLIAGGGLYYYRRKQSQAAAAAAAQAAAAAPPPGQSSGTQLSALDTVLLQQEQIAFGQEDYVLGALLGLVGTGQGSGTTPAPPGGPPLSTGTPAATTPAQTSTNQVAVANKGNYDVLGQISGATGSGTYTGYNVSGGSPVYAFVGGQWVQGYNPKTLPFGTELATPSEYAGMITGPVVTEQL